MFSFEPKNERNYFLNSALASKMDQIKKIKALSCINLFIGINFFLIHFKNGQKSKNIFAQFLDQMRTRKFAFEI